MVSSIGFRVPLPIAAALLLLPAFGCWSQDRNPCETNCCAPSASRLLGKASDCRAIEDAGTHQCWMLIRDQKRPAAPARLVGPIILLQGRHALAEESGGVLLQRTSSLLIHAGDSLIVDEHTAVADARLEATALNGAAQGERLNVRLKIGGRILPAFAIERGRAEILSETRAARP